MVAFATGSTGGSSPAEVAGVTLFYVAPWLLGWALFRMAARDAAVTA